MAKRMLVFFTAVLLSNVAMAGDVSQELPEAAELIAASIRATGGRAAYDRLENMVLRGTITMPGMEATITAYAARPTKSRAAMTLGEMGTVIEGTTEEYAWSQQPMQPPKLIEGKERTDRLRRARFPSYLLYWKEYFDDAKTVGVIEDNGRRLYEIVMTPAEGSPTHVFFDSETGLHVKTQETSTVQGQEVAVESVFADFKETAGVLFPHKTVQNTMGMQIELIVTSVKVNQDIPDTRFDPPKRLFEKTGQEKAPADRE